MTRFDLRPVSYPEIEGLDPSALWMEVAERDISFYFSCSSKESVAWCLSFGYYQEGGGIYIGNEGKFYTYEFEGKKVNMSVDVRRYRDGSLEVKWWVGDKGGLKAFYNHRCRLLMLHLPIFGHQRWMEVSRLSWHAKYRQGNGNLMWERYWGGVHFDDCPA